MPPQAPHKQRSETGEPGGATRPMMKPSEPTMTTPTMPNALRTLTWTNLAAQSAEQIS